MSNLQTALALARNGYYVHPLVEADKIPFATFGSNGGTPMECNMSLVRHWRQHMESALHRAERGEP